MKKAIKIICRILLILAGVYAALFNVQSKYYSEGGEEDGKEDLF